MELVKNAQINNFHIMSATWLRCFRVFKESRDLSVVKFTTVQKYVCIVIEMEGVVFFYLYLKKRHLSRLVYIPLSIIYPHVVFLRKNIHSVQFSIQQSSFKHRRLRKYISSTINCTYWGLWATSPKPDLSNSKKKLDIIRKFWPEAICYFSDIKKNALRPDL